MDAILNDWNIFKESWEQQIEKTQSNLFSEFDKFVIKELKQYTENKEEITIKRIYISNKSVKSIKYEKKMRALYIYQSPFYMYLFDDGNKYPSGFLLENFLTDVIKFIKHNNNEIKVIQLRNNEDED